MKKKNIIISIVSIVFFIIVAIFIGVLFKSKKEVITNENNKSKKEVNLNETFKLYVNESVSIKDENLNISLISVSDSRCPEGVECFWQGEINYTVIVNTETIEFGTELNKEKSYNNYKLIIDDDNNSIKFLKMKVEKK